MAREGSRPRLGRPPGSGVGPLGRGRRVEVYMPERVLERLDQARGEEPRSRSITEAVLEWLRRREPPEGGEGGE